MFTKLSLGQFRSNGVICATLTPAGENLKPVLLMRPHTYVHRHKTTLVYRRLFDDNPGNPVTVGRLRSSDTLTFAVPRTRTRLGDRSFAVAGPQIWNSLPADLRLVDYATMFALGDYYICINVKKTSLSTTYNGEMTHRKQQK